MKRAYVSSVMLFCMLFSLVFASQASASILGDETSGYIVRPGSDLSSPEKHVLNGKNIETKYVLQKGLASHGGHVTLNDGSITTKGNGASGISVEGYGSTYPCSNGRTSWPGYAGMNGGFIRTYGGDAHGAHARVLGNIALRDVTIVTSGAKSDAIRADKGSVCMDGGVLSADSSLGSYAINAFSSSSFSQGVVNLHEAGYIISGDVMAGGRGIVNMALGDGSVITGDVTATRTGVVNMSLNGDSLFTGKTTSSGESKMNLALNAEDTRWILTGDSKLTKLTVNGGVADMTQAPGAGIYTQELAGGVNGGGTFIMEAATPGKPGNEIIITGAASGSHTLDVGNSGGAAVTGKETITLVEARDEQTVDFALARTVELGGWQYELRRTPGAAAQLSGGVFELYSRGRASNTASAAVNSFVGAYMLTYAETQTIYQRLGEIRHASHPNGLWARVHGGQFESDARNYLHAFDMDYGGVQVGYDRKIETNWNGDLYAGIMFGYSRGDLDYAGVIGSGEVDSKTLGVYGTFVGADGCYVDAVLRYQWTDNEFDVTDTAGVMVNGGDASTNGFGASIEVGKRIYVDGRKSANAGWYVEPQAQLSYQRQSGGYFNASNDLRVGVESFTSLMGRLGVQLGYATDSTTFYGKVSRVKEFDGDLDIRANGASVRESLGGSWWVFGLGVTSKIGEHNNIYVDVERTSGGSFKQPWKVNLGWRMEI